MVYFLIINYNLNYYFVNFFYTRLIILKLLNKIYLFFFLIFYLMAYNLDSIFDWYIYNVNIKDHTKPIQISWVALESINKD